MSDEKKTKHTPGPWYAPQPVGSSQQWVVWSKKDGTAVADVDGPIASTRAANTTLIAAAPELAEAVKDALDLLEGVADEEDRTGKHNAAINVRECERKLRAALRKAGVE